jgi:vacuolar protein sorting-associated protein 35
VALIVGTLQGAKVFGSDNFDTLITKAALHGAKLLKKPHQSTAVSLASHMWWQETSSADVGTEKPIPPDGTKEEEENIKAASRQKYGNRYG